MTTRRIFLVVMLILGGRLPILAGSVTATDPEKEKSGDKEVPLATLTIKAGNFEGPARGNIELCVPDSDGKWRTFLTKPLVQGAATLDLSPGTYRATVTSTGEIPGQTRILEPVELKNKDDVTLETYFECGKVTVSAVDGEGNKASGSLALDRYDPQSGSCVELPANILVVDGRASLRLPPGKYRLRFTPDGIIGAGEQTSAVFKVKDRTSFNFQPEIEYGLLRPESGDYEGPLRSHITIWATGEEDEARTRLLVYSQDFDGEPRALKVAPGKYRVAIGPDPRSLFGAEAKAFDGVEITAGGTRKLKATFERGRAVLDVSAFDKVAGRIDLQRWHAEQKNYSTFRTVELRGGPNTFHLVPGKYRITAVDTCVTPEAEYPWSDIIVEDKSSAAESVFLERGRLKVVAVEDGSPAQGRVTVERQISGTSRRICQAELTGGAATINLKPGRYRVILHPEDSERTTATDWMELNERSWLMCTLFAGASGEGLPPKVDLWGPFEVGDDDGMLEANERINFSMRFGGERFAGAKVSLLIPKGEGEFDEREVAEIRKGGIDRDREQALEGPGEYILKIAAWDYADPRHETVLERRFLVHPRE